MSYVYAHVIFHVMVSTRRNEAKYGVKIQSTRGAPLIMSARHNFERFLFKHRSQDLTKMMVQVLRHSGKYTWKISLESWARERKKQAESQMEATSDIKDGLFLFWDRKSLLSLDRGGTWLVMLTNARDWFLETLKLLVHSLKQNEQRLIMIIFSEEKIRLISRDCLIFQYHVCAEE